MTSTRRTTGMFAAAALGIGLLATSPVAPAYAADAVAGAQTAGDSLFPNQGNGGYDVAHYDVDLAVDVTPATANGAVSTTNLPRAATTITAATTGSPLSSYSFDFQGSTGNLAASTLDVTSVTVDGAPATFSRTENTTTSNATTDVHKLVVTPAIPVDGAFTTVVTYSGRPVAHTDTDGSSEGWNNTTDGATFLNQPVGAMTLFPNNNTPRDKATYTFTVDAPTTLRTSNYANAGGKPYQAGVVSNGELVSRTPSADGTRTTWVWDEAKPMASELSLVSIGRYDIYSSTITLASGRSIPEWTFIDPAISVANQTTTLGTRAQLKALLDFYETRYGPYPGNSTGLVTDVVPSAINYALETQDRSFFPNSASRGTTYHEVMHQWWGDNVAPTDWNDIVLNEGPATYAETQFPYEGAGSSTTPTETSIYSAFASSASTSAVWAVPSAAMSQASQLFGSHVYTRGNYSLEALRTSIGAGSFETLMRQYQLTYGGGQITGRRTAAFQALAEQISGRDLTAFFQTWWFTTGKPAWPARYNLNLAGPTSQVNPGDAATYTLAVRNTGKVAMTAGQAVVTVDAADLLDDATLGTLPAGVTQSGSTLTWSVPATALAATSSVAIPVTVNAGTTGATLKAVARASTLGSTCLECTQSSVVGTPFVTPAPAPTITYGTGSAPTVGVSMKADTTGWAPGTAFAYQWLIDGTPVPGATGASYTPDGSVVGLPVTVRVTGTLDGANPTTQTSAATPVGVRATLISSVPTISGTPKIGVPLTVDPGTWQPGTVFTYAWAANGTAITGATGPVYTPAVATQAGQTLTVTVTGTKSGYTTTSRTSVTTAVVAAGDPLSSTPTPVFTSTPKVGAPFAASYGSWDDGTTLTFQWAANGTTITGATTGSYTPTAAIQGQTLTVTATGTKPGIPAVSRTSAPSAPVDPGTQTLQPTPTITGTPRAGTASTGVPGTWDTGTTLTYTWYADGTAIAGATALTYTPTTAQIGQVLSFEVTSTRAGYTTVVKTSAGKTVLGMAQTLTPTPTITGPAKVGQTLTVDPGTFDDGTTLTYQWLAGGTPVDGATGATYVVRPADLGTTVTVSVTSTKAAYETVTRTSAPTAAVVAGDLAATPVPTITGTPKVGVALTGVPGAWDDGATLTYQWLADGAPVAGETGLTYTPGPGKAGAVVTFAVTGAKAGYTTVTRTSDATAPVALGDLAATPVPTITGTPKVGVVLTGVPGAWDDGTTLTYQWLADGAPVAGETGLTYTPGPGKAGAVVTFAVTGTKAGYTTVTRTSDATAAVALGDLVATPVPTITGTPKVGVVLTGVPGAWDDGTTLTYQWLADGAPVAGETGLTYTPGPGKAGAVVTFAVTGAKAGYTTVTRTSDATAPVALGDQAATPVPTITGVAQVGQLLTAVPGAWDDDTVLTYQWLADGLPVDGATGPAYVVRAADLDSTITVAVTGTRSGYATVTRPSVPTAAVVAGDLAATPVPTISGTPKVGVVLTGVPGAWDDGTTLTFQWRADGLPVDDATALTFTPGPDLAGAVVTFAVTGTKAGYTTVTTTSAATAPVALGDQVAAPIPTITGVAQVGQLLTAVPGAWDDGTALTYQWLVADLPVDGATGPTYVVRPADLAKAVTLAVTGTRSGYTTVTRTSVATDAVAPGDLTATPTPTVTGTPKVGLPLTGVPGSWDAGTTLTYQWLADGTPVDGATALTYTPGPGKVGAVVTFAVTGTRAGYTTVTRTSSATAAVAPGDLTATPTPTITGTPKVGVALTGVPGSWDTGTTLGYQWLAGGAPVTGATGLTYTPGPDLAGAVITFAVTGTKAGYTTVTRTSVATASVALGDQAATPTPTITGTPQVGQLLTAVPGAWDDATVLTYQWLVAGVPVDGATGPAYVVRAADLGGAVTVAVTGSRTGYATVTRTGAPTAAVAPGALAATPTPTVTGTPQVGVALTGVPGAWDDGTVLTYQWLADGTPVDGATGLTYTPGPGEAGAVVTFAVTGTKAGYATVTRTSAGTAAVVLGDLAATPTPTISGTAKVGSTLSVAPGAWDEGAVLTYQWFADGRPIANATGTTYTLVPADVATLVTVAVTGTRTGYTTVTRTSAGSAPVAPNGLVATPVPTITGSPVVGQPLTAVPGTWDDGAVLTYQWSVGGVPVAGATTPTYVVRAADLGKAVTVAVTGTKPGFAPVTSMSDPTALVTAAPVVVPVPVPVPVTPPVTPPAVLATQPVTAVPTTGSVRPRVGHRLVVATGAFAPGTTLTYTWKVAGKTVRTAHTNRLKIKRVWLGRKITVVVTATNPAYVPLRLTRSFGRAR